MADNQVAIAIIGYGGMGARHIELINELEEMIVAGVFDVCEKRKRAAIEIGLHIYKSLEDVIQDPEVDIVLIATPNDSHKDIALTALNAGKHVICEKPVTLNSLELIEIMETARKCNRIFVVHQNRRWDEDCVVIKKIHEEKMIGELFHIESRVQGSRGIPGDWRKIEKYGGGMMFDWGVHLIDQLLYIVNEKVKTVFCKLSFVLNEEVDDGFRLYLEFESGKTAVLEVGTWNFDTLPRWYIQGKLGTATIRNWSMSGMITKLKTELNGDAKPIITAAGLTKTMAPRDESTITKIELPRVSTDIRDFYRNVVQTIKGNEQILIKNEEVLRVMRLIEAAMRSAHLRQVVSFE